MGRQILLITVAVSSVCVSAPQVEAKITVQLDPGDVGEMFFSKSFDVPELVGVPVNFVLGQPAVDVFTEVDFVFPDRKFMETFVFPGAPTPFVLEVTYDRPFPDRAIHATLQTGGNGGGVDVNGQRIPSASGAQADLNFADPPFATMFVGPPLVFPFADPPEPSEPYFGIRYHWGFGVGFGPIHPWAIYRRLPRRRLRWSTLALPHFHSPTHPIPSASCPFSNPLQWCSPY